MDEQSIFIIAIEKPTAIEREAFLEEACKDNQQLRQNVDLLIRAYEKADSFLEDTAVSIHATVETAVIAEKPGMIIGHYKLIDEIGRGGMGVVYSAAQSQPIKRNVALKIIKPGMDTREVVSRFESERQVLALMDHPNIAHVLDGGSTESGRPYFVMELVEGTRITDFCDDCRYTTQQRLELFVTICRAVQHAHQKGIIHRDIKPSNILVTTADDDVAVPKVIDFGIAKAIHQPLTDQPLHTRATDVIGTPLYMSPEQAQLGGQDVDTRTDVYSLGVVLYQLLAGATPFDKERMDRSGLEEVKRIIREEDPPRPSTRLSTIDTGLETIAEKHNCDPNTLVRELGGELDWIVMKCLEKDRSRRYESASELAKDIQRYLDDEPVEACPPSSIYRLRKFARRNKGALGTGLLVSAALMIGMAVSLWQANVAREAGRLADQRFHAEQEARRDADQQRQRAEANFQLAMQAMDELYLESIGEKRLLREDEIGLPGSKQSAEPVATFSEIERELLQRGLDFYDKFAQQNLDNPQAVFETGKAFYRVALLQVGLEENDNAGQAFDEAISRLRRLTQQHPTESEYFLELGKAYYGQAQLSRWWPSVSDTYTEAREALDRAIELNRNSWESYMLRGRVHQLSTGAHAALADYRMAAQLEPGDAELQHRLACLLRWGNEADLRDYPAALSHSKQAVKLEPQNLKYCRLLADIHKDCFHDKESAIAVYEQWIPLSDNPKKVIEVQSIISEIAEKHQETIQYVDRYIENVESQEPDATVAWLYFRRGKANASLGNSDEAIADMKKALELEVITERLFYVELMNALSPLGATELALAACDKARTILPGDWMFYAWRGGLCRDLGRYQESLEAYTKVVELVPRRSFEYKRRGEVHFLLGHHEKALGDLQTALELNPNDLSAVTWIPPAQVAACPDHEFRTRMLQLADHAVELSDGSVDSRRVRASLLAELGQMEKTRADLSAIVNTDEGTYYDKYLSALVALKLGDHRAYQELSQGLVSATEKTNEPMAMHFAAWTAALVPDSLNDYEAAIALAKASVAAAPEDRQFQTGLGAIQTRAGLYEQALSSLEKSKELEPTSNASDAYAAFFQAMTLHHLGRTSLARESLAGATTLADQELSDETKRPSWNRKLTLELLRNEAETLIIRNEHNSAEPTGNSEQTQ